eukprot:CCRYP_005153-RA/>CCRYP_005153-RA protein AED:0.49 eAED:0.49 QI:23/1/1/1/0/0/2/17/53
MGRGVKFDVNNIMETEWRWLFVFSVMFWLYCSCLWSWRGNHAMLYTQPARATQ